MTAPLLSVVMGTYNHAAFVAEAVQSVLAQDFTDFEFLIADDGSTDQTASVVAGFQDSRISFQPHGFNRGAAVVLNELISRAQGRYIAVLNSDDAWLPGKLAEQVEILESRADVGAVFGRAIFVDRSGTTIHPDSLRFGAVFDQPNRSRGEWLRHFLWKGNCLCHPSVMIRRAIYDQIGLYDNRLRQLPDFDMWIRLVKLTEIFVSPSLMVRFRILPGENTSSETGPNRIRTLNEHFFIALEFFTAVPASVLQDGFADYFRRPHLDLRATLEIEAAFLFLHPVMSLDHVYRIVAMMKLRDLLARETTRDLLVRHFQFDDRALHSLAAEADGLLHLPPEPNGSGPPAEAETGRRLADIPTREMARIVCKRVLSRARLTRRSARN